MLFHLRLVISSLLVVATFAPSSIAQKQARVVTGKDCEVRTDLGEDAAKAMAARIDEFCEVFRAFYDGLGLEARQKDQIVLRLFANFDDFCEFRERDGARANLRMYSSESLNAIVTYNDPNDRFLASKLFGLCSNMYLRRYVAAPPEWVRRGFEAFFRGYEVEPGAPARKAAPLVELVALQDALKKGEYIPLAELVKRSRTNFNDRPPKLERMANLLPDAEAWGLVNYLMELAPSSEQELFRHFVKSLNAKGAKAEDARIAIADWDKFEEAWKAAIQQIDAKCDTGEKHMRVADGYLEVLNYNFATPEFEQAYKLDPKLPGLCYKMAYALKRAGDYTPSIWWFEHAIAEDPSSPRPHYQLARLYSALDSKLGAKSDPAKALEHAQEASKLGGGDQPIYLSFLARCQALNGDKKTAVTTMKKAITLADKDDKDRYEKQLAEIQKLK